MAPKMKQKMEKQKSDMDTDEFLAKGLDTDSEEDSLEEESEEEESSAEEDQTLSTKSGKDKSASRKHKQSLEKLKESDPEFYEFLKNEDKELLAFEGDEEDDEEDDDDDEEEDSSSEEDGKGKIHKLPKKLEVASDDDESSDEENEKKEKVKKGKLTLVTMKMINRWSQALRESSSAPVFHEVVGAFKAAVQQAGTDVDTDVVVKYKVEGSTVFNSIVRLCLTDVIPMLNRFLGLQKQKDPRKPVMPSSSKKWSKVRLDVKSYLTDVIQLTSDLGEPAILNVLLKHVTQLVPFYVCLPKLAKLLVKKLIVVWSAGEETSRVLAFLTISKVTRHMQSSLLEFSIKQMYMAYVKNCKFTSPNSLPLINFMQRSLVEMFVIDSHLAYQHAFIYIRQLAIHLRNAITTKKKEACQAVYNWQFIHSLHLWARLLSATHPNTVLQPLIYPLTQTIIGTIKLIPTARYYPLRFHCVRALNILSHSTGTYIPTLPFILEIFELTDFNKKHKSISFKPFNFACILKMSKAQLNEKAFKDGVIDQIYELLMESLHIHAHTVAFPEISLATLMQLKDFLKKCKIANYTRQMKQILDKIQDTSKVITQRRRTATMDISNTKAVEAWEKRSKQEGTPLSKYYATWRKLRDRELVNEIAGKERISGAEKLPAIIRERGPRKATDDEKKEFAELFDSGSEDSDDDETRFLPKGERPKKKQKTKQSDEDSDSDDYSSLDEDEYDALNKSASEDDESGEEESGEEEEEDDDEEDAEEKDGESVEEEEDDEEEEEADDIVEDFKMSDFESD